MKKDGVPVVPGIDSVLPESRRRSSGSRARSATCHRQIGRRWRRARHARRAHRSRPAECVNTTRFRRQAAFSNPAVYLEKFLERPRHIEIQFRATHRNAITSGPRLLDQRRHQKVIEEAPAPHITPRARGGSASAAPKRAARSVPKAPALSSSFTKPPSSISSR